MRKYVKRVYVQLLYLQASNYWTGPNLSRDKILAFSVLAIHTNFSLNLQDFL